MAEVPYRPLPPAQLYLDRAEWTRCSATAPLFAFSPYSMADGAAGIDAGGRPGVVFTQSGSHAASTVFHQLAEQSATWARADRRTIVAAWTRGSRERIANLLRENGLKAQQAESWYNARRGRVTLSCW